MPDGPSLAGPRTLACACRDGASVAVRCFDGDGASPLVLDVHGGGYCYGHASADDRLCLDLRAEAGVTAASVEYRYYPEVTYPRASEDCEDALASLMGDPGVPFDRSRVFLMGHSAGANAAAAAAQHLGFLSGVILDYPWLDVGGRRRAYVPGGFPNFWLRMTARKYFPRREDRDGPVASPLRMDEAAASRFPRTLICVCGKDTLRADGEAFRDKLRSAGAEAVFLRFDGAEHGFVEIISDGRMKRGLARSARSCERQFAYYAEFLRAVAAFVGDSGTGKRENMESEDKEEDEV